MSGKSNVARMMLLGVILGAGATSPLPAAQLVTFTRGQAIVVENVERRSGWYYFTLEGGGEMGVPANLVSRVENYEAPPPAASGVAGYTTPASPPPGPANATAAVNAPAGQAPAPVAVGSPAPPAGQNPAAPAGANVMTQTDDWRYKVRTPGGRRLVGGLDRPVGTGRKGQTMGGGRLAGGGTPVNRRQPPTAPVPPQQ